MTETLPPPATADPSLRDDPGQDAPARLRVRNITAELLAGSALAVVVSMALQFGIAQLGYNEPGYAPEALATTGSAVALVALALLAVYGYRRRPRWLALAGTWAALSTFTTVALATPLQSTRFFFGGSAGDNAFRMQYLTRMASTLGLADMNYADAAPYYPAGWFWLGGRFANLLGWEGWAAYKPYSLVWAAVTAVVAFTLWSVVTRRRLALLAALSTTLIGMATGGFSWTPTGVGEPYAWPSAAWLPPIAVLTWRALSRTSRPSRWALIGIGAYLGFAAATYSLYFGFAVLVTMTMAALHGLLRVRGGESVLRVLRDLFWRLVPVGAVGVPIALLVWTPYLLATNFLLNSPSSDAPRFLPEGGGFLPVPMTEGGTFGVVCLIGLGWLFLRCRSDEVAAALLCVATAVYGWFALSNLALLLMNTTLLAFRLHQVLEIVLATAGVFGAIELTAYLRRKVAAHHAVPLTAFAVVLGLLGAISLERTALQENLAGGTQLAHQNYYPTGFNAQGAKDPGAEGAHHDELISTIGQLSGREPNDNIVLTTYFTLLAFEPYWGFQHKTPHYASPLADYADRNAEMTKWSKARDSQQLLNMLDSSRFEAPNVFVLRKPATEQATPDSTRATPQTSDDLTMTIREDSFPQTPGTNDHEAHFDPAVFRSPEFVQRDVGPFVVVARR